MSQAPRGLGRGLSAILGEVPSADELRQPIGYVNKEIAGDKSKAGSADIMRIPVDLIQPNPYQPRQTFNPEALEELSASIKALGLIQPITVRKGDNGKYQIISGERRFKASRMAGLKEVPAYIISTDDRGMMEMAIVENIQRENLDPIEVALSYHRLMTECNLTQEAMSETLGKKRATIANQLRLLSLPVKVQHDLKVGQISVGHAKVILSVQDPEVQVKLCDLVVNQGLSVRALEDKIKELTKAEEVKTKRASKVEANLPAEHKELAEALSRHFSGAVNVRRSDNGTGTVTIKFKNDEEVADFLNAVKAW